MEVAELAGLLGFRGLVGPTPPTGHPGSSDLEPEVYAGLSSQNMLSAVYHPKP